MQAKISASVLREMVGNLKPDWTVREHTQMELGIDSVYELAVDTATGQRQVVLKATTTDGFPTAAASAEPRIMERIAAETSVPVPEVFGICDDHPDYPSPYYLMDFVEGETLESDIARLSPDARERIVSTAGHHLGEIHDLGTWPAAGRIGYEDGTLQVLDSGEFDRLEDTRAWVGPHVEEALDSFDEGGYFPEFADDAERFADLAPDLREYFRERIPAMPEPAQPRWAHGDYRYGNLILDSGTGEVQAVVDWGLIGAHDPAYNLTVVESMLLSPESDGEERTAELREEFRSAYTATREEWTFDDLTLQRIHLYRLVYTIDAMACLPLWYRDATPEERDEREQEYRDIVRRYLD